MGFFEEALECEVVFEIGGLGAIFVCGGSGFFCFCLTFAIIIFCVGCGRF